MENSSEHSGSPAQPDARIAALLDMADEGSSIVDRLMSLPAQAGASGSAVWDAAVARRLEAKLAQRLRAALEGGRRAA